MSMSGFGQIGFPIGSGLAAGAPLPFQPQYNPAAVSAASYPFLHPGAPWPASQPPGQPPLTQHQPSPWPQQQSHVSIPPVATSFTVPPAPPSAYMYPTPTLPLGGLSSALPQQRVPPPPPSPATSMLHLVQALQQRLQSSDAALDVYALRDELATNQVSVRIVGMQASDGRIASYPSDGTAFPKRINVIVADMNPSYVVSIVGTG